MPTARGIIGGLAATTGRAFDYATPGAGTSSLTHLGRNISNVNTDIYGNPTPNDPSGHVIIRTGSGVAPPTESAPTESQTPSAVVDPYSQWGGQTNYNNLVNDFNAQKQGIVGSAQETGSQYGSGYNRSILDFLDSQRLGQQAIDTKASQNELAKQQGYQGVLGMVGRGIRSSGVQLGNRNAGNSSAAGALANAYGQLGRGELSKIGNQYEQGNQAIAQDQSAYGVQQASGLRNLQGGKNDFVNNLVLDARNKLSALDSQIAGASLPNRIAIDQEKEAIKQQVLGQLQQYDTLLTSESAKIAPTSIEQRRAQAAELARAGTDLGAGAFDYSTETPLELQGTGPFSSELPLFTLPRRRVA